MSTRQTSAFADALSYSSFSAWAQWLMTSFTTFGWTQTADYGQVNWTNLATSNVVTYSNSGTSYVTYTSTFAISGTFAATGGLLTIPIATTTGLNAGQAVLLTALTGSAGAYNGYMFTIASVIASTSISVVCPAGWSFSYATITGTATLQPAFMIFQANDTLAASYPIYCKLELYGYNNTSTATPQWRIQIGTGGTNGYGLLTAPYTAVQAGGINAIDALTMRPCYASGDSGSFRCNILSTIGVGAGDAQDGMWFVISRSKDNNGNSTGNYVMLWSGAYSQASGTQFLGQTVFNVATGGTNLQDVGGIMSSALPSFTTYNNNSGAFGGTTLVAPVHQNVGGLSNPTADFLVGARNDFPLNTTAQCTVYGTAHNYISCRCGAGAGASTATSISLLLRYE